jgi:hypothetical protein
MVILHVSGDHDFSALMFEKKYPNIKKAYKKALDNEDSFETKDFSVEIKRYRDVDPKFIEFLNDHFYDYDARKAENFYIVEP